MDAVIKADPKATEEEHKVRFWAAIQNTPKKERDAMLRSLAGSFLGQRRTNVLRSMRSQAERDADKAEREAWVADYKKQYDDAEKFVK